MGRKGVVSLQRLSELQKKRIYYLAATSLIFMTELFIALFVRDRFIRPYVGDMLVVVLIYTFLRILLPEKPRLLPLYVFLFAALVEGLQGIHIVELLGLQKNRFFSVLIGTTFDWKDIACYGVGCVLLGVWEYFVWKCSWKDSHTTENKEGEKMPFSVTKSVVSEETICAMVSKAFGCEPKEIIELTEGFFNVAYRIELEERPVILKVAPSPEVDILTYEKNIMWTEVDSMKLVKKETKVPVPEILFYDDSRTLCDRTYFFMELLPGRSFSSCMEELSEEEKSHIFCKVGEYTKELNQITGTKFGYYGQPDRQGSDWYTVFEEMLEDAFCDAERKEIAVPVEKEKMFALLKKDKAYFEEVTTPKFVHWDIWAGNVFVDKGEVTGIIDFERALWADELMEVGFRTYEYNESFFAGYGREELTESEKRRALWYDIFLFQIARLECDYRQYDNRWAYDWSGEMLLKWKEILS